MLLQECYIFLFDHFLFHHYIKNLKFLLIHFQSFMQLHKIPKISMRHFCLWCDHTVQQGIDFHIIVNNTLTCLRVMELWCNYFKSHVKLIYTYQRLFNQRDTAYIIDCNIVLRVILCCTVTMSNWLTELQKVHLMYCSNPNPNLIEIGLENTSSALTISSLQ